MRKILVLKPLRGGGGIGRQAKQFDLTQPLYKSGRFYEELRLNSMLPVNIFPSPVSNGLNIKISDAPIGFHTAKIISSTGEIISKENLSDIQELQLDTREYPKGIYIIEFIDDNGNRLIEKFLKI